MPSPPQAASTVSVTVVSELWSRLRATVAVAQAGGPRGAWGCLSCIAGIFQYETISCSNCTDSHVICFGYYCKYGSCSNPTAPGVVGKEGDLGLGDTPPPSPVSPPGHRHSGSQLYRAF